MFTISWLLSSICCLMNVREFVVKVIIPKGTYPTPLYGYSIQPGLFMVDPDAEYGFRGDVIVATLLCNPAIMTVGVPYG